MASDQAWYLLDLILDGHAVLELTRDATLKGLARRMEMVPQPRQSLEGGTLLAGAVPITSVGLIGAWDQRFTTVKHDLLRSLGAAEMVTGMLQDPDAFAARMAAAQQALFGEEADAENT